MITKHSKLLSVIDAIEIGCSPFEIKIKKKWLNMMILSFFQILQMANLMLFYQMLAIPVLLGKSQIKIDKETGGWQKSILSQQIVLLSCY